MTEDPSASHRPLLAELPEEARALALERFHILRPFLEEGVPLTRIAQEGGLKLRTVQGWATQYRRQGLAGFLHQGRADRGGRRRIPPDLQHLVEGLALRNPPPTAAFVHRQVAKVAEQRGWPVPSYGTVYAVIHQLDPALTTLAHDGPKVYREEFDLLYRRLPRPSRRRRPLFRRRPPRPLPQRRRRLPLWHRPRPPRPRRRRDGGMPDGETGR